MSNRNRIIYQSEALFTSPSITGAGDTIGNISVDDVLHLKRITDISNSAEITRQNVNVFGKLSAISREIIEEPTVTMDFSYYLADGYNESGIGIDLQGAGQTQPVNCLSGILANNLNSKRNFYVLTVDEGVDANGIDPTGFSSSGLGIIGIGNSYLSNYTAEASVGEIPTASVSVEASNITFSLTSSSGFANPSLNVASAAASQYTGRVYLPSANIPGDLSVNVLRPGDIVMDFGSGQLDMGGAFLNGMSGEFQSAHIQSFSIDLPLSRTPQQRLGNSFAFSRELDVPIDVTLNVTANLADITEGSLNNLICAGSEERNIIIKLYGPCGAGENDDSELNMVYELRGATLDSQSMTSTIGDNKTVELTFTSQIGGPNDILKGLFISGKV